MNSFVADGFRMNLMMVIFLATICSFGVTINDFYSALRPLMAKKNSAVAAAMQQQIEYAVSLGIPINKLVGIDEYLSNTALSNPEIALINLHKGALSTNNASKEVVLLGSSRRENPYQKESSNMNEGLNVIFSLFGTDASTQMIDMPIRVDDGNVVALLTIQLDSNYIIKQLSNTFFDTLVILVAALLITFEISFVVVGHNIAEPLRRLEKAIKRLSQSDFSIYPYPQKKGNKIYSILNQINESNYIIHNNISAINKKIISFPEKIRDKITNGTNDFINSHHISIYQKRRHTSILDARIPLFIFCFAEEMQKSFLPLFVAEYYQPTDFFERSIMVGLPISIFMFVIAALTPFAGSWVDRFGSKKLFFTGLLPAIMGYLLCSLASNSNEIVFGRSLTAVGYAIITISSQCYIANVSSERNKASSMAVFVGVLMTATMCGTAIGSILAEWVGYKMVFLMSAVLAMISGIVALRSLDGKVSITSKADKKSSSPLALLKNRQFVLIILFCAIPAKIVLTGILYLFVPMYLANLDAGQSEIGRVMMLYSLIIIPTSPIASSMADRLDKNLLFVIFATVISGIVLIALQYSATVGGVLVAVAALGVVHSFLKAPLIVAAMNAASQQHGISRTSAMSLLRTSERIGSVIGPLLVATLISQFDYSQTATIIGVLITALGISIAVILKVSGQSTTEKILIY